MSHESIGAYIAASAQMSISMMAFFASVAFMGYTQGLKITEDHDAIGTDFGEEACALIKDAIMITKEETGEFRNQVAGHVKQPILTYKGSILKPLNKRIHFFRELRFYYTMQKFGSHWTQSDQTN